MTSRTPIPLMLLAFFPLLFGSAVIKSLADSGSELQQAQGYFENSDYQRAEQIYQGIIKQCSDANQALEAQKGLVMVYISLGKQAEAETAYQQLLLNFPHNTHMADVIHHGIASHYRKCKKDDKADELDKYVLSHWPTTESAMWAQVDIVGASINSRDYAGAQAGVDNLFAGFANNEHLCDAIHSVAYRYRQSEKNDKADELDQYVLNHWPSTESAMWAQVDIINSNIDGKDYTTAQTGIDNLLTRFSINENMANVLHGMAYKYRQAQETTKADELDQYVLDHWPSSEIALWARVDIIKSAVNEQGYTAALANVDNLLTDFANEEQLVSGVLAFQIVDGYRELNQNEKAYQFYRRLISNWPGHKYTLWSQTVAALANIQLGDITAAEAAIDKLRTDFSTHPKFSDAALIIAGKYYEKGLNSSNDPNLPEAEAKEHFQKAITVWNRITQELPASATTPLVYHRMAYCCFEHLGEYEKAIEYCKKVVDDWPDYEYAWQVQFSIGNYYERLIYSGLISESEANPKIEQAYQAVIENYPDCASVKDALLKLGWLDFKRGQWLEASQYFESGLDKYPEDYRPVYILYPLGRAYEEIGQLNKAADVYTEFINTVHPDDPRIEPVKARLEQLIVVN